MSLTRLLSMITRTGTMTEPVADAPIEIREGFVPPACLRGSAQVRHVDAGSCNGCEIELGAAFGPVYDAERFGARLVASPRHADVVTVAGVVTQNMVEPLLNTIDATPNPRVIISIGDCTRGCGVFAGSYAVAGSVDDFAEVDVHVTGCPPAPEAIIAALRAVTRR